MPFKKLFDANDYLFIASTIQRMHLEPEKSHMTVETTLSCDVPAVQKKLDNDDEYAADCFLLTTAAGVATIIGNRDLFNDEDAEKKILYFMQKVKERIEIGRPTILAKGTALDQEASEQLENSIDDHLKKKLKTAPSLPHPPDSRFARLLLRFVPVSRLGRWPFKHLLRNHVANPWMKYAQDHPVSKELHERIGEDIWQRIAEDEKNEKLANGKK